MIVLPRVVSGIAPRVGARIETFDILVSIFDYVIAPRVGARIETDHVRQPAPIWVIAPRVGARIETPKAWYTRLIVRNRPPRGGADRKCHVAIILLGAARPLSKCGNRGPNWRVIGVGRQQRQL